MITRLEVLNFRALKYVRVPLSEFQVLVGANATGKSTFFDALLFVRDILQGGPERAVLGDHRLNIAHRATDPRDLTFQRQGGIIEIGVSAELPSAIQERLRGSHTELRYEVAIDTDNTTFVGENLWLIDPNTGKAAAEWSPRQLEIFPDDILPPATIVVAPSRKTPDGWRKVVGKVPDSGNDYFKSETSRWNNLFRLGPTKSALANLPEDEERFPAATWFKRLILEGVHRLALNAGAMRLPSPVTSRGAFLPDGSNLPWAVHELERSAQGRFRDWVAHLCTALDDISDVETREREADRARYLVITYADGLEAPSWLLSDGTLRMLALTFLAYMERRPSLILIEEPENGIHPKAVQSVIQSLSSVYDSQVFVATHSPIVLSQQELPHLLCFGKTAAGAVDIVAGPEHPRLQQWKSSLHLGDLFAAGVLG